MKTLFVTGTDTGVGKTRVAVGLMTALAARGHTVAGFKPVASGSARTAEGLRNEDALALQRASTVRLKYAEVNPFVFEPPIAPHIAAAETGVPIDMEVLERAWERLSLRASIVVIEGAGGWLTPLGGGKTLADFAAAVNSSVVLVVGLRLGCLNHAMLSAHAIRTSGLEFAGWVGNAIDPAFERPEANLATLTSVIPAPCLGRLPYDLQAASGAATAPAAGPAPVEIATLLRVDSLDGPAPRSRLTH